MLYDKVCDNYESLEKRSVFRFKTREEFIAEYCKERDSSEAIHDPESFEENWRLYFNINEGGKMDYLLGTPITKEFYELLQTYDYIKIKNKGKSDRENWNINIRLVKKDISVIIKEILKDEK